MKEKKRKMKNPLLQKKKLVKKVRLHACTNQYAKILLRLPVFVALVAYYFNIVLRLG